MESALKNNGLDSIEHQLIASVQNGLPIADRPYAGISAQIGISEGEVIKRISSLIERGFFKRFGVVVRHHELGYRENAMVVWDFSDDQVKAVGNKIKTYPFITLCYRRPRQLPEWRYNLFCMIHGKSRDEVEQLLQEMISENNWSHVPHDVLFSKRRFKQSAANYITSLGTDK